MKLFKKEPTLALEQPAAMPKPPILKDWSESELASVYSAAPVKALKKNERLFEIEETESFYVLLSGGIQVVVKWHGHEGRPAVLRRGDLVAPLPKSPGLLYRAEAVESTTLIEITPAVLKHLPDKTQLSIFKTAMSCASRINAYIRAVNGEVTAKNGLLSAYILRQETERAAPIQSEIVQTFIRNIPRMPAYAMDLTAKLLAENTSVQEVVEGIKRDPAIAAIVLRTVNSAQYSFHKKIESFYHACMILGFNNTYNLIMREAVQSAMPVTAETQQTHNHSCLISVLCHEIASAAKEVPPQTASTIGLLHDIGKSVQILMKRTNPTKADYIDTFHTAKLGAELLHMWGLPERICKIVEFQQQSDFTPPDMIAPEYRREIGSLYIAHALESLLNGRSLDPESSIYIGDYMATLGISGVTPGELLTERVLPNLRKNIHRIPEQIREVVAAACERRAHV